MTEETEEVLWHVSFDDNHQPVFVKAKTRRDATAVVRRVFDRRKYDFDWEECAEITRTEKQDVESEVRGDPPHVAIVPYRFYCIRYEKRVNQAGFKGVYQTRLYY